MDERYQKDVSYIVYECTIARFERIVKRLIILLIIAISLIFLSNAVWLYVWNQYEFTSDEITVDSNDGGNANYIGANSSGVINNGYGKGENTDGPKEESERKEERDPAQKNGQG